MQRSINHLKKRFEFALKTNKPLWVNENDINALNSIIEIANGKPKCNQLEDSLMLFYLLQYWKFCNAENGEIIAKENPQGIFRLGFPDAEYTLKKLTRLIHPKSFVIQQIYTEMRALQALAKVPTEERVKKKDLSQYLNEVLEVAKNDFPITRELHKGKNVKYDFNNKKPLEDDRENQK